MRVEHYNDQGVLLSTEVVPDPPEVIEATAVQDRIAQARAKARAILADPVNAPDWTAAERKVLLAVLMLRAT